jgi:hemerythrin-like domain-containing protein
MPALLNELRDEHKSMAQVLDCLDHQMLLFESGGRLDFDVVLAALDYFADFPEQCHHPKEDVVFRRLCARDADAAKEVGDLAKAHEQLTAHFLNFDHAIRDTLAGGELPRRAIIAWARDFIERQRIHMTVEETRFFPVAEAMLTEDDWQDVVKQAPRGKDPLAEGTREAQFKMLERKIVAWDSENPQN